MKLLVESHMAQSIEYFPRDNKLVVEYCSGKTYVYKNVSNVLFLEMISAESLGKWFHNNILKNPKKYPFIRMSNNKK